MASTFLSPGGDYQPVGSFCGVKDPNNNLDFMRAVDMAASSVRAACGPVMLESGLTFESDRWGSSLVLPFRVAALASVTDAAGVLLPLADFRVPPHHLGGHGGHRVTRKDGGAIPPCVVTYSSGWAWQSIPAELVGAGYEVARQYWRSQLGSQRTGDEQQGRAWSAGVLVARYAPADWLLAPLGFA